jgi:cell fate (sporulation/competence/biofilm development) regulator YlbF (YheA/YmcA/DUF963 family)
VQLDKLSKIQDFVNAMNQLSMRLGNLDNLTDAIANRLSSVLYELVNQLTKADASINNAHQLQEKRKKLIEDSVSKIENLMSQHMIVEISQMTDEEKTQESMQTPGGLIDSKRTDTSSAQGTDTNIKSTENKLESPEVAKASTKPGSTNNSNALTKAEFETLMQNTYAALIAKKVKEFK